MFKVISFYRYAKIDDPQYLRFSLRSECQNLGLLGRVLIAKEGINGAVSGRIEKLEKFKLKLQQEFPQLTFREQNSDKTTYHKLVVRVRDEICAFNSAVDVKNAGNHLSPEKLKKLYDQQENFFIIDARNNYEYEVGRFKDAIRLPIKNFREFAKGAEILEPLKEKKIVLYCTGGIRCEKASAFLKEQGFKDVNQLDGGIINYVNQFPENNHWEGGLFVFDDRLVSDTGEAITSCKFCNNESKQYVNCHNLNCDKLFIACEHCLLKNNYSCSESCQKSSQRRKEIQEPKEIIGLVENYYPIAKVALVRLREKLNPHSKISIFGKTTKEFTQEVETIQNHENSLVTFSVKEKVRKNDKVALI
ncbi:MAG TPA: rhodanese-related sulfurtransferase [Candidatus Nanoarchaeia archaeon]|nr:rhodanese-related sulfurtransferase [Candidatus Nanoarchaeia archaeon]